MNERAGLLAELPSVDALHAALRALREDGYTQLEAYTPFDDEVIDDILERPASRLPWAIGAGGALGALGGYALQWWTNVHALPLRVGHRPPHFVLAFVPITFEMGVLVAALTGFLGVLWKAGMPRLWSPVLAAEHFESSTNDRFWIAVESDDPIYGRARTERALRASGAERVVPYGDEGEA